jgi:DNA-binding NarL/FixJ family response regulator
VAAADVAQALSEARPHRPALEDGAARATLRDLCDRGALCARAVDAILASPGARRPRGSFPAGLSEREVEVLRLVARGLTDKEVAAKLGISHRTVHHHNKHAYDKIGVSTRAAAALFLVENDLLDG